MAMRFDTDAVHGKYDPGEHRGSLVPPIYQNVATLLDDCKTAELIFGGQKEGTSYIRYGHENSAILEKKLALLDGGEDALAFETGMAAIFCLFFHILGKNGHLVSQRRIYGGTSILFSKFFPRMENSVTFVENALDIEEWKNALRKNTKAVFAEMPANPTLDVSPLEKIAEFFQKKNIPVIVDSTFVTPALFRPIEWGAEFVARSLTKYENPGGTNSGGIIVGPRKTIDILRKNEYRVLGATISPFDAWLCNLGLAGLGIRMKKQSQTALKIARFLEKSRGVKKVYYPLLPNHTGYFLAKKYFPDGAGAVVSVELEGPKENAVTFAESLKIFSLAVNLGDIRSLIIPPAATTHSGLLPEEKTLAGISDTLVRLSCGLEDPDDLKEDLEQALRKI
ncbi:MAG: hypothetical protein A3D41_02105 [Candidatus Sungbacteria bacterium RIFCSPHIGHO2_02_FULL_41_12b]|nr:MAG: hypothetical protein A3D41_02105 [Candidatus Sungbacteria bacterium RIFCSPHIGHO2_02_FULL_41_12b]